MEARTTTDQGATVPEQATITTSAAIDDEITDAIRTVIAARANVTAAHRVLTAARDARSTMPRPDELDDDHGDVLVYQDMESIPAHALGEAVLREKDAELALCRLGTREGITVEQGEALVRAAGWGTSRTHGIAFLLAGVTD